MHKSIPAAAIAALMTAFLAGHGGSYAAPNDCLAAPNGAAPSGQHWFYHLDRANNRKCWYLRDIGTAAAKGSAGPSQQAGNAAPTKPEPSVAAAKSAAALQSVPRPALSQPAADASASSPPAAARSSAFGAATSAPPARATPVDVQAAMPSQPAAAPGAGTPWSDPPPPPAAPVVAPSQPAPSAVTDPPLRRTPVRKRSVATNQTQTNAAAPVLDKAASMSVAQNVLVMLLAALLAGGVFATFAMLRRRKPVNIRAGSSGPRFGSRLEREDGLWLKWPRRGHDSQPTAPIQTSLIPQQVSVTRQSVPRR
jgi:hypothetical protein